MLIIIVEIHKTIKDLDAGKHPWITYHMDHDDQTQRRVLGEQCRNAFEAGQCVVTYPKGVK